MVLTPTSNTANFSLPSVSVLRGGHSSPGSPPEPTHLRRHSEASLRTLSPTPDSSHVSRVQDPDEERLLTVVTLYMFSSVPRGSDLHTHTHICKSVCTFTLTRAQTLYRIYSSRLHILYISMYLYVPIYLYLCNYVSIHL